ncbi:hypothetical protein SDC9_165272 [bioreactor metagenome]|uniref:Uncharacterized protein n=1 Tax=bioreactor metagenome TaxID=1076179 RepID=A0A645FTX3_9ZZZZ
MGIPIKEHNRNGPVPDDELQVLRNFVRAANKENAIDVERSQVINDFFLNLEIVLRIADDETEIPQIGNTFHPFEQHREKWIQNTRDDDTD